MPRLALGVLGALLPACHRPAPPRPYTAYVVNRESATLAAVNLASFHLTATIALPPAPIELRVRPGSRQIYVVSETGKVSVVAFPRPRLLASVETGKSAKDLAFAPDGRFAYLLDPVEHEVVALSCEPIKDSGFRIPNPESQIRHSESAIGEAESSGRNSESAIGKGESRGRNSESGIRNSESGIRNPVVAGRLHLEGPVGELALASDGRTLAVSLPEGNQIALIAAPSLRLLGRVDVGRSPGPLAFLPDGSKVFVGDEGEDKLSAVQVSPPRLLAHLEMGVTPTTLVVKPDGGELFALAARSAKLAIVDAFHDEVEQTFPLGRAPAAGVFRRDMSVLYITDAGDGSVEFLDARNRLVLALAHVGIEPRALALTPDERFLVVADTAASSLAILHADPATLSLARSPLTTTVTVGAGPVDVVVPDDLAP